MNDGDKLRRAMLEDEILNLLVKEMKNDSVDDLGRRLDIITNATLSSLVTILYGIFAGFGRDVPLERLKEFRSDLNILVDKLIKEVLYDK